MYRSLYLNSCPCITHYYDPYNNSPLCFVCNYKCLSCLGSDAHCTSCPSNSNRVYDSTLHTCNCQTGTFEPSTQ